MNFARLLGTTIVRADALTRPWRFRLEKMRMVQKYPQHPELKALMEAFEKHYIAVEYGAHDRSLIERRQRNMTERDEFVYGTTPWLSFAKVLDSLTIQAEDVFIEPGCGMGHLCFLVHQRYGIESIGFEALANFIDTTQQIKKELPQLPHPEKLKFYNLDFFKADLSRGTLFYIAGTCFPLDYKTRLLKKVRKEARSGSQVITLTHPIELEGFRFSHEVKATFSWGRDRALIYTLE